MKTIHEQIESVQREIGMRQRVYKKWVADGNMTQEKSIITAIYSAPIY